MSMHFRVDGELKMARPIANELALYIIYYSPGLYNVYSENVISTRGPVNYIYSEVN